MSALHLVREVDLQRTLDDLHDLYGYLHFHDVDARRDRRGFPDSVFPMPKAGLLCLWELKTENGKLRPEQVAWGEALEACRDIDYRVLRPSDLDWIRDYLMGE